MSKEKRRVPKLRFPGFTEDWEQRKLSDILVERNEQQVETNEYPLMSFVQGHGVIPKGERYDRSFLVLDQSKKYKRTELGDFIYSSNNLETGSIGINKTGKAVISPVYSIFYGVSIGDSQFIGIMSLLPRFITKMIRFRQGVVYGQWRIHEKDFLDISILIPSEAERTKITKLILSIEELITLHQRKLDNLKLKKKALLQKLFPKNGERYPELRFPGFTDAWEQRKLGDVAIITGGGTPSTNVPEYWNGDIDWYSPVEIGKNRYVSKSTRKITKLGLEKSSAKLLPIGTVLFTSRAGIGNTAILQAEGCTNQGFQSITPDSKELDTYFLYTMTPRLKRYGEVTGAGSTFVEVSGKQMEKMSLVLPSLEEQKQIGRFFRTIDDSITLHQRKLEKLKLNKSALLQKLFPQKGCTIPDVRFKGFTDAWEQRKLNDFGIATGGTSIESEFVDGGTYKVINIGSYSEESVYNDQGLRVNKTDKTKSRILNKYDLTMILNDKTASGNIIGRVLLIDQDNTYVYNQRTERIEVDTKDFLPMFLYHMLNAPEQRKYIVKASQGNTQIYVNWSTISNIDYMIPQLLLEQEKIANLFSLINKDITLHQRKLDCLISIKKGLLQQLFV